MPPLSTRQRPTSQPVRDANAMNPFAWLEKPVQVFQKNPRRAFENPDAALRRVTRSFVNSFDSEFGEHPSESFGNWLSKVTKQVDVTECEFKERLQQKDALFTWGPAAAAFWPLVEAANERFPNSPLVALPQTSHWGPAEFRAAAAIFRVVSRTNGKDESYCRELLSSFAFVAEQAYSLYLKKLYVLAKLGQGQVPTPKSVPSKLGQLCVELSSCATTKTLVDPEASKIRNAAAHATYRYVGRGRLLLWDEPRKDGSQWSLEIHCEELRDRAMRMLDAARGLLSQALPTFLLQALGDPMWSAFMAVKHGVVHRGPSGVTSDLTAIHDAQWKNIFAGIPKDVLRLLKVGHRNVNFIKL